MIKVKIGTNVTSKTIEVDESTTTPRQVMDEAGLDYNRFTAHLNGDVINAENIDKTFAANDIYEDCFITSVTKTDSAI